MLKKFNFPNAFHSCMHSILYTDATTSFKVADGECKKLEKSDKYYPIKFGASLVM